MPETIVIRSTPNKGASGVMHPPAFSCDTNTAGPNVATEDHMSIKEVLEPGPVFDTKCNACEADQDDTVADESASGDEDDCLGSQTYEGVELTFADGSRWELSRALSPVKYQQATPPFEASQVFASVCVEDPDKKYAEHKEAVIKVKYQVRGTDKSTFFFWQYNENCGRQLAQISNKAKPWRTRTLQAHEKAVEEKELAQCLLLHALEPALSLHEDTKIEINALKHLTDLNSAHAPHLLDVAVNDVRDDVDDKAMPGGYAVFMLMTKLPGEALSKETFWNMDEETREDVRHSFKDAMIDLWESRIVPQSTKMSDLIWNGAERKCYLADFEQYDVVEETRVGRKTWTDDYYRWWRIAEECKPDAN
ncbi:hypothetical protein NX059_009350 [Plenodomus lindquistii]|nr:hypothetical protein NX059_009350 [Plenodomus lindquistii]